LKYVSQTVKALAYGLAASVAYTKESMLCLAYSLLLAEAIMSALGLLLRRAPRKA
jgi:hypothetical protein